MEAPYCILIDIDVSQRPMGASGVWKDKSTQAQRRCARIRSLADYTIDTHESEFLEATTSARRDRRAARDAH
jgi:hypothetical protein